MRPSLWLRARPSPAPVARRRSPLPRNRQTTREPLDRHPERIGEDQKRRERWLAAPLLEEADVRAMEIRGLRERFLGVKAGFAQLAQARSEALQQLRPLGVVGVGWRLARTAFAQVLSVALAWTAMPDSQAGGASPF